MSSCVCVLLGVLDMLQGYSNQPETVLEATLCTSLQYDQVTRLFDIIPSLDTCHYDHTTGRSVCLSVCLSRHLPLWPHYRSVCLLTPRLLGVYYFLSAIFAKISNCFFFFVFRWNCAIFGPLILRDPLHKTLFFDFWFTPPTPKIDSPKFGQKSPITRLVWQIGRRCLRLIGGFGDSRFNGTVQNIVGPTLVAMETKIWQIWATFSQKSILLFCLSMESSHFWAVSSPCGTLQNVVLRFLI